MNKNIMSEEYYKRQKLGPRATSRSAYPLIRLSSINKTNKPHTKF